MSKGLISPRARAEAPAEWAERSRLVVRQRVGARDVPARVFAGLAEAHQELTRPELQLVAALQRGLAAHALPVDERAVAAAEVHDADLVRADADNAVVPADGRHRQA